MYLDYVQFKAGVQIYMKKKLPNIFSYNDFRKYLADYHQVRKANDRRFTKSAFSQMLDLPNTRSYINDVLKESDSIAPYKWYWNEDLFGKYIIKVIGYDNAGNSATKELVVWKFSTK